jgi:hypothetical protein
MNTTQKEFKGQVAYFNPDKMYGFIIYQEPRGENQVIPVVHKYFFHAARLVSCECDVLNIRSGMLAHFNISKVPPKLGNLPYAIDVELYFPTSQTEGLGALATEVQS